MEKKFDIYSSSGQGLLQEMSIAQLRTELVLVKRWLQHEEDIKRRKIHAVKIEVDFQSYIFLDIFQCVASL